MRDKFQKMAEDFANKHGLIKAPESVPYVPGPNEFVYGWTKEDHEDAAEERLAVNVRNAIAEQQNKAIIKALIELMEEVANER